MLPFASGVGFSAFSSRVVARKISHVSHWEPILFPCLLRTVISISQVMQTFHSEAWLWPPACGFLCHSILVGIGFLNRVVSRGFAHIHFPCTFLFPRSFPSPLAAFVFTAQSVNILSEALALGSLRLLAFSLHH